MTDVELQILRLPHGADLPLPSYQSAHAAGLDLLASVPAATPITLLPGERGLVPCGIAIALPHGFEAQVRPRSGLAVQHGVTVLNAPGTIDADYRGEVHALLRNWGTEPFVIRRGDRIAQMVICPVAMIDFKETKHLPDTRRGSGGFGHSGRR